MKLLLNEHGKLCSGVNEHPCHKAISLHCKSIIFAGPLPIEVNWESKWLLFTVIFHLINLLALWFYITTTGSTTGSPIIILTCSSIYFTQFPFSNCLILATGCPVSSFATQRTTFPSQDTPCHRSTTHLALVYALSAWLFFSCPMLHLIHAALFLPSCNFACSTAFCLPRSGCSQSCCKLYVRGP